MTEEDDILNKFTLSVGDSSNAVIGEKSVKALMTAIVMQAEGYNVVDFLSAIYNILPQIYLGFGIAKDTAMKDIMQSIEFYENLAQEAIQKEADQSNAIPIESSDASTLREGT